jgi:hypothetical protein
MNHHFMFEPAILKTQMYWRFMNGVPPDMNFGGPDIIV